jgi:hypothetical protein
MLKLSLSDSMKLVVGHKTNNGGWSAIAGKGTPTKGEM